MVPRIRRFLWRRRGLVVIVLFTIQDVLLVLLCFMFNMTVVRRKLLMFSLIAFSAITFVIVCLSFILWLVLLRFFTLPIVGFPGDLVKVFTPKGRNFP